MQEAGSNDSGCTILVYPIQAEHPKAPTPICWSDDPDRVLARLRLLRGPEWWR
jgi:hypothetical protein